MEITSPKRPIRCQRCGGEFLHHDLVTCTERAEGLREELTVTVQGCDLREGTRAPKVEVVPRLASARRAQRRQMVEIRFWCEGCGTTSIWTIEQHKGQSLLYATAYVLDDDGDEQ